MLKSRSEKQNTQKNYIFSKSIQNIIKIKNVCVMCYKLSEILNTHTYVFINKIELLLLKLKKKKKTTFIELSKINKFVLKLFCSAPCS